MAWGLLILFVAAVLGPYIWYNWVKPGLDIPPVPEPPHVPFITSAVGTGPQTIHLSLNKDSHLVELERFQPDLFETFRFVTASGELDDTDLHPDRVYRYRA